MGVDLNSRSVDVSYPTSGNHKVAFDFLIVAAGMQPSYFGHDEFARYAPGLKNLSDAETIRTKILSAYELAELTDDEDERSRLMTLVLVGGGPTGVELAASMAQMAAVTLRGNFRHIDPTNTSIVLIEGGNRILPTFAECLSRKAARRLEKLGVKVLIGTKVEKVDERGVVVGGKRIPSATVLWTAGLAASPVVKTLGVPTDRAGRLPVDPFLRVPGASGVFAVGDAAVLSQRRTSLAGRGPGRDSAGTLRGQGGCQTAQRQGASASVPIFRQGKHGRRRQELCRAGARSDSNQRVHHLAGVGVHPRHDPSAVSEPAAGAKAMALVIF
jgi:NADH:ubiquinone reductase (H+-translocating)